MTFSEWIESKRGRLSEVAEHFDVSLSAVTQWKTNGVPIDRMFAVRELSGGVVSIDDMVASKSAPGSPAEREAA